MTGVIFPTVLGVLCSTRGDMCVVETQFLQKLISN